MGNKIQRIYVGDHNQVRPQYKWEPDSSRTLLYLKLNSNTTDSSGNSVTVNNSGISYGTIGNNHYAQLTSTTGYITPTASLGQQVGAGDFTVSFYFYPVSDASASERAWLFGDWYDSASPRQGICIRWWKDDTINRMDNGTISHVVSQACSINTWHYQTYIRRSGVCYCFLDGQYVGQHSHTYNFASPGVNKFYILNRSDYSPQRWVNTGARISEVIFEKVAWTNQDVINYYNLTKGNYGL